MLSKNKGKQRTMNAESLIVKLNGNRSKTQNIKISHKMLNIAVE